jgi:hypothetical protein
VGSERCRGTFQPVVAIDGQPLGFWEPVNCRPARVEARMRWPWSIEPGEPRPNLWGRVVRWVRERGL